MPVHPTVFLDYGTECINRGRLRVAVSERTYKAHFKLTPTACSALYTRLQEATPGNSPAEVYPSVRFHSTEPRHLLWALHYVYTNTTEEVGCAFFGVTPKTYRKYVWSLISFLKDLSYQIVSFVVILRTFYIQKVIYSPLLLTDPVTKQVHWQYWL